MPAPVALFVYNRPAHTRQTLRALQANDLAAETELFIFSDGPKRNATAEERQKIDEVRAIAGSENWCGQVHLISSENNKGLAASVIEGVTEIVNRFGKIIVLEDDLVTSPSFLRFMNESLEEYAGDERVISITGYTYPVRKKLPESFFLRGADCWGWATWKRGWDLFEKDGKKLLARLEELNLVRDFDFEGTYPYTQMLRDQAEGKISSWAIRWYASAFINKQLTLYPGKSLVQNIGVDGSGTHSGNNDKWQVQLSSAYPKEKPSSVGEEASARAAFADFFRQLRHVPLGKRILNKFSRLFS